MNRNRSARLAAIISTALLGAAIFGSGSVSAATPKWSISIVKLPPTVVSGQDAGYRVTIKNAGPSNINGLTLDTQLDTPATYFSGLSPYEPTTGSCVWENVKFSCNLGTLNAGQSTTFTIAYTTTGTSGGTFDVTFRLKSSSGDTGSDGPKSTSRGDALSVTAKTGLNSGDFYGGYFPGNRVLQTNPTLTRNTNKQATTLTGFNATPTSRYDVMISDGTTTLPTDSQDPNGGLICTGCGTLKGEWSFVNLKEGITQGTPFHVTIMVIGTAVSGTPTALAHVYYRTDADGNVLKDVNGVAIQQTDIIGDAPGEICASPTTPATTEPGCVYIARNGSNWQVDASLFHNGGLRLQ